MTNHKKGSDSHLDVAKDELKKAAKETVKSAEYKVDQFVGDVASKVSDAADNRLSKNEREGDDNSKS